MWWRLFFPTLPVPRLEHLWGCKVCQHEKREQLSMASTNERPSAHDGTSLIVGVGVGDETAHSVLNYAECAVDVALRRTWKVAATKRTLRCFRGKGLGCLFASTSNNYLLLVWKVGLFVPHWQVISRGTGGFHEASKAHSFREVKRSFPEVLRGTTWTAKAWWTISQERLLWALPGGTVIDLHAGCCRSNPMHDLYVEAGHPGPAEGKFAKG